MEWGNNHAARGKTRPQKVGSSVSRVHSRPGNLGSGPEKKLGNSVVRKKKTRLNLARNELRESVTQH